MPRSRRLFLLLLAPLLLLALWATPEPHRTWSIVAQAQESDVAPLSEEDYAAWERTAQRAEEALDHAVASDAAFESLRSDLASWRSRFQTAQERNAERIATLERQIDSLGPVPEDGGSESPELTARRAELQDSYQTLVAPVRRAGEAFTRADGLITRIDILLRGRQADKLLQRGASPLVPANILAAAESVDMIVRIIASEISSAARLSTDVTRLRNNLPQIIVLSGLALLLLFRGRRWFGLLVDWVLRRGRGGEQALVAAMILSLGQIILPTIGLVLLSAALLSSSMFGPSGDGLIRVLPAMGIAIFAAHWLGGQLFPRNENWPTPLDLTARERVRGRFYSSSLGVLMAVALFVQTIVELFPVENEAAVIFAFPVILLASMCLSGIARLLISHGSRVSTEERSGEAGEDGDERGFVEYSLLVIGRICRILAYAAPILAIVGYTRAAILLSLSPSLTLAIMGTVSFLQRLSTALSRFFRGSRRDAPDGLFSVLVNFALAAAALPFVAVVWGMRPADLQEIWVNLQEGVTFGDTQISPTVLFVFALAFGAGLLGTRIVQAAMRVSILPRTGMDLGGQKAAVSGLGYLGMAISFMIAVSVAGLDLSGLAIVAGALSVGVGFGLQNIVSNFVSGLILLVERPVTEGDWIEVGGVMGIVRRISVRATTIETFDRNNVVVPNSDFVSGQVTNWTRGNLTGRLILPVGVAYGSDTRKVAAILQEIAEEHPLVIVNPPPTIVFQGFGADSLDFEMRVILRDINFGLSARTELNHRIAERFVEEGIEIPYAQRDIWLRNPEALRSAVPGFLPETSPDSGQDPATEGER